GVPRRFQRSAVFPIEMVVPHPDPKGVLLQAGAEPVARSEELFLALFLAPAAKQVVIPQAPLSDGNRVVLQADLSVVIQQRNTSRIVGATIIGLLEERHVVFAKFCDGCAGIHLRLIVPEGKLAFAWDEVGTAYTPVVF